MTLFDMRRTPHRSRGFIVAGKGVGALSDLQITARELAYSEHLPACNTFVGDLELRTSAVHVRLSALAIQ
jgi:hypothetical protein